MSIPVRLMLFNTMINSGNPHHYTLSQGIVIILFVVVGTSVLWYLMDRYL